MRTSVLYYILSIEVVLITIELGIIIASLMV